MNAKDYTLTEYINDINRENTEVLAEYGADEKVRRAYSYGESGIGERVSVDKSEESSYYLYDGRNSVTGILIENPLTRNRYDYTTNNPLNYSDPAGHSLWSRIKSTAFKSYVSERTAEIRSEVVRHMCTTTNHITDQLGKVNWKNVAIGVTAMVELPMVQ